MSDPIDLADKYRLVDDAYAALTKMHAEVSPSREELMWAIEGPASRFYLGAIERENEAAASLPMNKFMDLVDRWYKNWREVYRAVVRERLKNGSTFEAAE